MTLFRNSQAPENVDENGGRIDIRGLRPDSERHGRFVPLFPWSQISQPGVYYYVYFYVGGFFIRGGSDLQVLSSRKPDFTTCALNGHTSLVE